MSDPTSELPGRPDDQRAAAPLWDIDSDGNVKGVVFSEEVDAFVEFVDEAIVNPAVRAKLDARK